MILNTNISWDYREFSSTNLGYLVDNCSGLLTDIWAFTVCFPIEMVDTGLGHTPLESQFSGDGSSELQRAFYKEEREEEWDSEQEGSMLKGSRLHRGCVFWGVLFFGSLPLWKHCSWPYYLPLPSLTHKGMPIALQPSAWWSETVDLSTFLSQYSNAIQDSPAISLMLYQTGCYLILDQIFVSDLSITC